MRPRHKAAENIHCMDGDMCAGTGGFNEAAA